MLILTGPNEEVLDSSVCADWDIEADLALLKDMAYKSTGTVSLVMYCFASYFPFLISSNINYR